MVENYKGKKIDINFDEKKCIHSRYCVLGDPKVFKANVKGSWIDPDQDSQEKISNLIEKCPSGALTFHKHEGNQEKSPEVNTVRVLENGPLAIHAEIKIDDEKLCLRSTLCRCGKSKNKPYCDLTHKDINFEATGEPLTQESEILEKRDGELKISPGKDGPLRVSGNLEIISGTGRTINRVQQVAFCRCGHSSNKPYCDGTHRKIGFKSD